MRQIVAEFEALKRSGRFDDEIFRSANLTAKIEDVDTVDYEGARERGRRIYNEEFLRQIRNQFPDMF